MGTIGKPPLVVVMMQPYTTSDITAFTTRHYCNNKDYEDQEDLDLPTFCY